MLQTCTRFRFWLLYPRSQWFGAYYIWNDFSVTERGTNLISCWFLNLNVEFSIYSFWRLPLSLRPFSNEVNVTFFLSRTLLFLKKKISVVDAEVIDRDCLPRRFNFRNKRNVLILCIGNCLSETCWVERPGKNYICS